MDHISKEDFASLAKSCREQLRHVEEGPLKLTPTGAERVVRLMIANSLRDISISLHDIMTELHQLNKGLERERQEKLHVREETAPDPRHDTSEERAGGNARTLHAPDGR
jgi:hypothetical protein